MRLILITIFNNELLRQGTTNKTSTLYPSIKKLYKMNLNGNWVFFFLQDVKTQRFSTTGWLTIVKYNLTILYYILNTIVLGSTCISVFNFKRDNKKMINNPILKEIKETALRSLWI